jgi:4'-phosphopantetheinyl transferase
MDSTLTENSVHVWYCHCDDPLVSAKQQQYMTLLASDEIARYTQFAFEKDRRLFLVARALLRTTLSRYAEVAPDAWRFETTAKGKPFLTDDLGAPPLDFNVSHSDRLAACVVTQFRRVGIDVESTNRRVDPDVTRYFLSPSEMALFLKTEGQARQELFYRYWTLKESFAKALGLGLSMRLTEFSFVLNDQTCPTILFDAAADGPEANWHFLQQMIAPHYCLAVAAEAPRDKRPEFVIRCEPPRLQASA